MPSSYGSSIHTGVDPRHLEQMAGDVGQLVDPIHVAVPNEQHLRTFDDRGGPKWRLVTHPPLLVQLELACAPSGTRIRGPERYIGPRSKPAASVDALDALRTIGVGVRDWRRRILPRYVPDWRDTLRAFIGAAPTLAPAVAADLADDIRAWWRLAAVMTGWRPDDLKRLR